MNKNDVDGTSSRDSVPKERAMFKNSVQSHSFRTLSLRSSFYSVASSFRMGDSSNHWTCQACSYQNVNSETPLCSVCGTKQEKPSTSSFRSVDSSTDEPPKDQAASPAIRKTDTFENSPPKPRKCKFEVNKFKDFLDSPPDIPDPPESSPRKPPAKPSAKDSSTKPKSKVENGKNGATKETKEPETDGPSQDDKNSSQGDKNSEKVGIRSMSFAGWSKSDKQEWVCAFCTYVNEDPLHLTCDICGQARGQKPISRNEGALSNGDGSSSEEEDQASFLEKQKKLSEEAELETINNERWEEFVEDQMERLGEARAQHDSLLDSCEEQMSRLVAEGENSQREAQRLLDDCKQKLENIERIHAEETREQQVMEAVQQQRREIIEREEGPDAFDQSSPSGRPRKLRRKRTLVWTAQQRMIDDWRQSLESRQSRMESIRQLQDEIGKSFRNPRAS